MISKTDRVNLKGGRIEPSMWVDEAIWGHRMYDEQTPWLIYLEFLNVFVYEDSSDRAFEEPKGFNTLEYAPERRLHLRNILFNYPIAKLEKITRDNNRDNERWRIWQEEMEDIQQGLNSPKFDYLQEHFETFEDFVEVIKVIHSTCLEISSNKRWTSKFVFPYCKEALFEDLDKNAKTNDRRFFGRTGELLYLMFCRSSNKNRLRELLKEKLLKQETIWSTIVKCLQPDSQDTPQKKSAGFLPYKTHDTFDKLANDWISILNLKMPGYDLIPHLVRLAGLHMMLYQQQLAREEIGSRWPSYIISEIVAPRKTLVRELSIESYQENNTLSLKAVIHFIDQIRVSSEWQEALSSNAPYQNAKDLLTRTVKWPRRDSDYTGVLEPEDLLDFLMQNVKKRHQQHVGNIHRVYGREVGLISKRGTNRLRYAPTDELLKTLILTNVNKRLELSLFLNELFQKYGIVISDKEAERMLSVDKEDLDKKAFQANTERLEQRLSSIGLLRRLSDGCAYILNPYSENEND